MGYPDDGAVIVGRFDDYVDLALAQASFEQTEKADFSRQGLAVYGMGRMNQQVDITTPASIVHAGAKQPNFGFLSEGNLGRAQYRLDLLWGQSHARAFAWEILMGRG